MSGRTTIVLSHDLTTAREAISIVVLEDAHIAEWDTHQELDTRGDSCARLYSLRHDVETHPHQPT